MKMNISSGNSLVYVKSSTVLYDWFLDNIKEKPRKKKESSVEFSQSFMLSNV